MALPRRDFLSLIGVGAAAACVKPGAEPGVDDRHSSTGAASLRVDVWHDLVCPWCRIGCRNLGAVVDAWDGPPVEVAYHPFLLEPGMPPEGRDLRERLAAKYGVAPEQMFERVTAAGARYGVSFNWEKVRIAPSTIGSHALLAWAPAEKTRLVLDRLHEAYFDEGRDLGDPAVLGAVAASAHLDEAEVLEAVRDPDRLEQVRARARAASSAGISGVPYFRIGGRAISGAQPPAALHDALVLAARRA